METYQELYFYLFGVTEDALRALACQNIGVARDILIKGQREAEESILSEHFHDTHIS